MPTALPHLTADAFYRYLKCPHWPYWDLFGDPKDKADVPPMLQKLREDGVLHEKRQVALLGPYEEIPSELTTEAAAAATVEAMRHGVALIYQGTLLHDDWAGRPDLLRRVEEPSELGAWSYEAIDVKSSREVTEAQSYQLVFYALLLKAVQGRKPEKGKIINVDGQEKPFRIEDAEPGFFDVLERLRSIRAGEKPSLSFMSSCKDSPWFALCRRDAEAADDVALLYKIYRSEAKRLREAGYGTLAKLAASQPAVLRAEVKGVSAHRLERLRLQAQALRSGETLRIDSPRLPDAPVELHYDIEGDPMIGVDYLHGLLVREGGRDTYHAFAAEDPADEGRAWTAFCDVVEGYAGAPIYHYGWYELEAVRRLSAKHGISRGAARALDPANMIDLNRTVQRCVIFPLHFYSLKDVAKRLGFRWRAADASGANSVLWFQEWCERRDPALFAKIRDYNEDDVRATAHLKDWLVSEG